MDSDFGDRLHKYGFGSLRLLALLAFYLYSSIMVPPSLPTVFNYGVFGVGGAFLNLHTFSRPAQLLALAALALCFLLQQWADPASAVLLLYFAKTVVGDWLAGKLDHADWLRALLLSLPAWLALSHLLTFFPSPTEALSRIMSRHHARTFLLHAGAHFLCEVGDGRWEERAFWRHRYSYELTSLTLFAMDSFAPSPLAVSKELLLVDGIASLLYRITNLFATLLVRTRA